MVSQRCFAFMILLVSGSMLIAQDPATNPAAADYLSYQETQAQYQATRERSAPQVDRGPTIGGRLVPKVFTNPVLPGNHPDPSLCRVDRTYYLVTGSTAWFPGIPLYRSQDLVNWEHLGHALDRPEQRFIHDRADVWEGCLAPTIRYFEGIFYIVSTARLGRYTANFYVTAQDPAGPWSDPIWLKGEGSHPSIFFGEDKRAWILTQERIGRRYQVQVRELDLERQALIGPATTLVAGQWGGGFHLYRFDDHYLLLVSAGGSSAIHSYRSCQLRGPYFPCEGNPVLRLGSTTPLTHLGRMDIVQTHHHDWWAVVSANNSQTSLTGQETYLLPLHLKPSGPVFASSTPFTHTQIRPNLGWHVAQRYRSADDFAFGSLHPLWGVYRTPRATWWSCLERSGWLRLQLLPTGPTQAENSAVVARRVQDTQFYAGTRLDFLPAAENESAGLILMADHRLQLRLAVRGQEQARTVTLILVERGRESQKAQMQIASNPLHLALEVQAGQIQAYAGTDLAHRQTLGNAITIQADASCQELLGGARVGMYATSAGRLSDTVADFDWFDYQGL